MLTGVPGIGKTTIIQRVLSELSVNAGGFYTQEVRQEGVRKGFRIVSLDGEEGILAHVDFKSRYRVGKYGVNREDMERVGVAALERALRDSDLIIMDEIGKMELFSSQFQEAVLRCLDSPQRVLGTIQKRQTPFIDSICSRKDVTLLEVTSANRVAVVQKILDVFHE